MEINETRLKNKLRLITIEMPSFHTVCCALAVKAGSRFEKKSQQGLSHFLEHLVFKGTDKYDGWQDIAQVIEGVGGQFNAYTDIDVTFYHTLLPKKYYSRGLEVISELVFKSKMREADIEKEKPVIEEEIRMYKDIPREYVNDLATNMFGEGGSLSQTPIGESKTVGNLDRIDFKKYANKMYRTANMTLVIAGAIDSSKAKEEVEKYFEVPGRKRVAQEENFKPTQTEPRVKIKFKKTNQAHLLLLTYGYGYDDPKKYAWIVLNSILGNGAGSRLFYQLREKRSLCYSANSSVASLSEIGGQGISAGLNRDKIEPALKVIMEQMDLLRQEKVEKKEINRAKELIKGGIDMDQDDVYSTAQYFAEKNLLYKEPITPNELKDRIDKVGTQDILEVAQDIYRNDRLNLAIIGPYKDEAKFKKLLKI